VLLVAAGMAAGLPLLRCFAVVVGARPELSRKTVHVAMGLACMAFPWCFDRPQPVWLLAAVATVMLVVLRMLPQLRGGVGEVLHGVERLSFGELCFAPAVAMVFQLAEGDALRYVVPLAVLTVADTAGALAGTRWGRIRYGSGTQTKTILGSVAFLAVAWCCIALPLVLAGRVDWSHALWIGLVLSVLAMMAEGMADRGFDNLAVPLLAAIVLDRLLLLDTGELAERALAALVLLGVTLGFSRWSTLNGGALLGGALLGYACAVIADWRFVLPPLAVFGCHLATTRRLRLAGVFEHRLDAVFAHALSCLPWVLLAHRAWPGTGTCLAGISFAMGTQLALLDTITRLRVPGIARSLWWSVGKGWGLAALPGLVWLWRDWRGWSGPALAAIALSWLMAAGIRAADPWFSRHLTLLRCAKGLLALLVSALALLY
jgi:phytol kinase